MVLGALCIRTFLTLDLSLAGKEKHNEESKQLKSACALLPEIVASAWRMPFISKKRGVLHHIRIRICQRAEMLSVWGTNVDVLIGGPQVLH